MKELGWIEEWFDITDEAYRMLIEMLEYECDKYNKSKPKDKKQYQHEYYLKEIKPKRKAMKEWFNWKV